MRDRLLKILDVTLDVGLGLLILVVAVAAVATVSMVFWIAGEIVLG